MDLQYSKFNKMSWVADSKIKPKSASEIKSAITHV